MQRENEINGIINDLEQSLNLCKASPSLSEMPKLTLTDKGIDGPSAGHFIEEIHTPFNLAYIAVTTGTTAFQNVVGVVKDELPDRILAGKKALSLSGVTEGDKVLITYPPLVNVFTKEALEEYGVNRLFLARSSREAVMLAVLKERPKVIVGESAFLRLTLTDAATAGILQYFPENMIFICAGTPLDLELLEGVKPISGAVHDLYGCQEFGWLTLDGIPLREDITLIPAVEAGFCDLIVGGLSTGDCFKVSDNDLGHICNNEGKIITHTRKRADYDYETIITETTAASKDTVLRLAKTIIRIKAKIVRVSNEVTTGTSKTVLSLRRTDSNEEFVIDTKTALFDSLLNSQLSYQSKNKKDPAWIKRT